MSATEWLHCIIHIYGKPSKNEVVPSVFKIKVDEKRGDKLILLLLMEVIQYEH